MNRDPFESLRSRNPVPPESLPDAPLQVASAITADRPSWRRGLAIALASAVVVLTAGGFWLAWGRGPGREMAAPTSPATIAAGGDVVPALAATEEAPTVVVYFLDAGTSALVPVARDLSVLNGRPLPDLRALTLQLLLFGPGAWDAATLPEPVAAAEALLTSAIPAGTRLLGLEVADGMAMVNLSEEFTAAPPQAVIQVVFTLTGALQEADAVGFLIEGAPQVVASRTSGLFTPYLAPAATTSGLDAITREFLSASAYLPPVMIENPAVGATLRLPETITGIAPHADGEILLHLVADSGEILWQATSPATCSGCPAGHFAVEVPASLPVHTGWFTLRAYPSALDQGPFAEHPVRVVPEATPTAEEEVPEATLPGLAAPWSADPLTADAVPAVARDTWAAADNATECALLFPTDPAALGGDAVLHDRYFGGGWGLAWNLPSGPGRWEPGGEYCADCGREAFGVAGAGMQPTGDEDAVWANRLAWTYEAEPGPVYSHAGYGYEGVTAGEAGEPLLAYLLIADQGCLYNVWSYLGEEHLLALIGQLRFVEGAGAP